MQIPNIDSCDEEQSNEYDRTVGYMNLEQKSRGRETKFEIGEWILYFLSVTVKLSISRIEGFGNNSFRCQYGDNGDF